MVENGHCWDPGSFDLSHSLPFQFQGWGFESVACLGFDVLLFGWEGVRGLLDLSDVDYLLWFWGGVKSYKVRNIIKKVKEPELSDNIWSVFQSYIREHHLPDS